MIRPFLVGPPRQRLERHDRPGREIADRLIGQPQRAVLDGAAQRGLHAELRARDHEGIGLVGFAVAAFLRALHRELGVADHLLRILGFFRPERDADRAFDPDLVIGQPERCRQRAADAAGEMVRLVPVLVDRHQDTEFVAADPGQQVARAQRTLDPAGDGDEQFVADQRTETGVQPAEPRQIDDQQRVARPVALDILDHGAEALAIGQPGQAVGRHLAAQAAFGMALRRLVNERHHAPVARQCMRADEGDAVMARVDQLADAPREVGPHRIRIEEPGQSLAQRDQRGRSAFDRTQSRHAERGVGLFEHQPATVTRDDRRGHRHQIEHAFDQVRFGQRLGSRDGAGEDHWSGVSRALVKSV